MADAFYGRKMASLTCAHILNNLLKLDHLQFHLMRTCTLGLLRRLAEVHPGAHVDVRLGTSEAVQKGIADGSANLALFNDVGASAIQAQDLFSEPLIWLVLNGGRAARQEPLPLAVAEVGCVWRDVL